MQKINNRILIVCVLGVVLSLAAAILMHGYIGSFSRYLADDFCTAGTVQRDGYQQAVIGRYFSWDGRYSFSALAFALELVGEKVVPILPIISILIFLISNFFLLHQLMRVVFSKFSLSILPLLCLISSFLIFYTIPNHGQNLYWFTGIITYLFPIIFEFFTIGLFLFLFSKGQNYKKIFKILYSILLFVLSFFTSGFSEVATTIHIVFAVILFLGVLFITKKRNHSVGMILFSGALLSGAIAGFLLMVMAPGNAFRELTYPPHSEFIPVIVQSMKSSLKLILKNWLMGYSGIIWPSLILLLMFGIYFSASSKIETHYSKKNLRSMIFVAIIIALLLITISFIPSYWAMSKRPPDRVMILPITVLSICFIYVTFMMGYFIGKSVLSNQFNLHLLLVSLLVICAYFIVSVPYQQARNLYNADVQAANTFADKWDERKIEIANQKSLGEKNIDVLMIGYNIMGLEHIQSDPTYWINNCAALYYQVDSFTTH